MRVSVIEEQLQNLKESYPDIYILDQQDKSGLESFLKSRALIKASDNILKIEKAGEGNMNCTLRVRLKDNSLIVKQARPWVEKYPEIPAPWERILFEGAFYERNAQHFELKKQMPELLFFDSKSKILVIEDLVEAVDFTDVYQGKLIGDSDLKCLLNYLRELHALRGFEGGSFKNTELRLLNHAHIFSIPLDLNNSLDLDSITPGLRKLAIQLTDNKAFVEEVKLLGNVYMRNGTTLLHGDYYPGSWLHTNDGPKIIDPEFCYLGRAEWDLGVLLAHLHLAQQPAFYTNKMFSLYRPDIDFDKKLVLQFAGVEIMRRLIGYAQLPLGYGLAIKQDLLRLSVDLVLDKMDLDSLEAENFS
jgi:5-methylthioribose kinase